MCGDYLPNINTTNESFTIDGRGCALSGVAAGAGPKSAVTRKTSCVLGSSAMVRACACVGTSSTTEYLAGESSCTTVSVPLPPFDANAYLVPGSNASASTPSPIAGVAITFPVSALITAIILLLQPANKRRFAMSMASPEGSSHGASGQVAVT